MSAESTIEELSREDYAAMDKVLRRIDTENSRRASLETFANWKLGFKLFRDLELHFERAPDRKPYEDVHRALLTSFLALTEVLLVKIGDLEETDLARISLSKEAFAACARYLRQKYDQWFAPIDSSVVRQFETRMAAK
jgi:hypothetical protein